MKTITPAQLHQQLATHPDLHLLDVRTGLEFDELHVPQARNIPLHKFNPRTLVESGQITKDQPIYLLCRSGSRACKAADKLARAGLDAVVVEGGTQAWCETGLPIQRGESKIISLERQVRIAAGSLVVLGVALALFVHPAFIALSAFVGAGLVFAGITDFCGMGLLLARMPWNNRRSTAPKPKPLSQTTPAKV
jgi:rhodanese-related sulfurtransferase